MYLSPTLTEPFFFWQTSKKILQLTRSGSVWRELLKAHVVRKNLPLPGIRDTSLDGLQGPQLESLLKRALELHRNWTSPQPVAKEFSTFSSQPKGRIVFLQFLKRPAGSHWLLSLSARGSTGVIRRFNLECWDVSSSSNSTATPTCIARREFQKVVSITVNQDTTADGVVAIQAPL